jgi:hypothetical protein
VYYFAMSHVAVENIRPVLETLRLWEPTMYKAVQKDIKDTAYFVVANTAHAFPAQPWTSRRGVNWTKYGRTQRGRRPKGGAGAEFPRYKLSDVRKGVDAKVGGRKRRDGSYPIVTIRQKNAGGQIYDLALNNQKLGKESFVRNLNAMKAPSRVMWPTVLKYKPRLEKKVEIIIKRVEREFSLQIAMEAQRRANLSISASRQSRNALGQFGKFVR